MKKILLVIALIVYFENIQPRNISPFFAGLIGVALYKIVIKELKVACCPSRLDHIDHPFDGWTKRIQSDQRLIASELECFDGKH